MIYFTGKWGVGSSIPLDFESVRGSAVSPSFVYSKGSDYTVGLFSVHSGKGYFPPGMAYN